jgi:hypothetical protein
VLLWGARLSVSSKQGDVTLYLVDLSVQDGPYADTREQLARASRFQSSARH